MACCFIVNFILYLIIENSKGLGSMKDENKGLNINTTNEVQSDLVNLALQSLERMTVKEIQPGDENILMNTEVEVLDIPDIVLASDFNNAISKDEKVLKKKRALLILCIIVPLLAILLITIYYFLHL